MLYNNRDLLDYENQILGIEGFGGCTFKQYHEEILKILKQVDKICKENNITYFLMYGTLIGAVRHHGFVPWDDDVDIALTRENFICFKEACKGQLSPEYDFISHDEENGSGYTFSRIRKKSTTYIIQSEISKHGRHAGLYIDVMTLDYLSNNPIYNFIQKRSLLAIHRLVSPGFSQGKEHLYWIEDVLLGVISFLLGKRKTISLAEKILGSVKEKDSSSIISNCLLRKRIDFPVFDKIHFKESYYVPFEDILLPIPYMPITLLNHSYFKAYLKKGLLLEYKYDDEYEAVLRGNYFYYNDIMYIPPNRTRASHLEIFFDDQNGSEYYDQYYFQFFNKRKNDRCAVKERRYKERAERALTIMRENSAIAKSCCCELRYKDFLRKYMNDRDEARKIDLRELVKICDAATKLKVIEQENLTEEELLLTIWAFIKCSYLANAKRLFQKMSILYPDDVTEDQEGIRKILEESLLAYYAVFEHDIKTMEDFVKDYPDEEYLLAKYMNGILLFERKDYDKAGHIFKDILSIDEENQFLAKYYMGVVEYEKGGDIHIAEEILLSALDTTNYMPFLQMVIDKLKEIEGQRNE